MKPFLRPGLNVPFSGKTIVLGGDFRQILLAYQKDKEEVQKFAKWILKIGDGKVDFNEVGEDTIDIPADLLIDSNNDHIQNLINFSYPNMLKELEAKNDRFYEERAVLAPTLENVEEVNNHMLPNILRDAKEYLSFNSTCKLDVDLEVEPEWFTSEFLNSIKCSSILNHDPQLKVGVPIMLLLNIDQSGGLCNGTRLIVSELGNNVIAANVFTGNRSCDKIFIPRMRGPSGIHVSCIILAPPRFNIANIGRGWRLFCQLHCVCVGTIMSILFTTEDIRIVDVIFHSV
ncbi:uncharacterized protein LOC130735918 [Lotus japonicus]|uniref:uncharacterized protein LOC130735918 n=1 Tax=Lotus japonicus TaxID=34305 RepID=UPI0025887BA7|nr:uncharacterized protein LOC130735918 [Lotus japonicus]